METVNLRPAIEQAPNDGRWSRKQLRAACGEKQNDAQWWEQRFPGWKMEKCIVLEPGGLHESPKREGTGWERAGTAMLCDPASAGGCESSGPACGSIRSRSE